MEQWKYIVGYEGHYQVSNLGRVKSFTNNELVGNLMKLNIGKRYVRVGLSYNGNKKIHSVHRLVAQAFIPNPENKLQVNHKNGVRNDNTLDNLEWCTASENIQHAYTNGLVKHNTYKENHPMKGILGSNNPHSKKVNQLSLNGKFIKIWGGTNEIQRELGLYQSSISRCCNGKLKTAYGFIWKYA